MQSWLSGPVNKYLYVSQFLVSVSKDNSSTAEVLESISRSVRVKPENLRLAEVRRLRSPLWRWNAKLW